MSAMRIAQVMRCEYEVDEKRENIDGRKTELSVYDQFVSLRAITQYFDSVFTSPRKVLTVY